jgi:formylglycine-generating enzyme required for sulfatase activity
MKRTILVVVIMFSAGFCFAACPSADLTGDCRVDFNDFALMSAQWPTSDYNDVAIMANQWLTEGVPNDPCNLVWVDINDPGVPDHEGFNGQMSKYETTNAQYCEYLNAALVSGDIYVGSNIVYGADGSNSGADFVDEIYFDTYAADSESQIDYNDVTRTFSVRSRDSNNMSDHPVVGVSWYGATAFCNYYGYRLPTEWEWQAVADFDGSYAYGCGATINKSKANYWDYDDGYANPLNLSSYPYTSPVDYYSSYGYGMNDMAGNAWEWTSSINGSSRVLRGGCWSHYDYICTVSLRSLIGPYTTSRFGFRACR